MREVSFNPMEPRYEMEGLWKTAFCGVLVAGLIYFVTKRIWSKENNGKPDIQSKFKELTQNLGEKGEEDNDTFWQRIKDCVLSSSTREAADHIFKIIESLNEINTDKVSFKTPIFILLALIQQADVDDEEDEDNSTFTTLSEEELKEGKRIGQFALNIYPASLVTSRALVSKLLGVDETDLFYVSWIDNDDDKKEDKEEAEDKEEEKDDKDHHHPKFVLFRSQNSLILCIRGTFSITDVLIDVVCVEESYDVYDGFVHKGILQSSRKILDKCQDIIKDKMKESKSLKITGHSLGAATAEIITMELLSGKEEYKVECIALAPPPVFRSAKKLPERIRNSIQIFINAYDIVPRLSLATVALLLSALRKVDDISLTMEDMFYVLMGDTTKGVLQKIKDIRNAVKSANQERFPFLEHPGIIRYFSRPSKGIDRVVVTDRVSEYFSRKITLFDGMFLNHLQPYYQEALDKAVVPLR